MRFYETLVEAVPTGKAVVWIGGAVAASFLAGIGFTTGTGDVAQAVDEVPVILDSLQSHSTRISRLEARSTMAENDRRRILCLVTLTATGEELSPLEVAERCP